MCVFSWLLPGNLDQGELISGKKDKTTSFCRTFWCEAQVARTAPPCPHLHFLHVQPWWTNMATDHTRDPTEAPTLFSEVPSVSFALLLLLHTGNPQSSAVCISCSTVLFLIVLLPLTLGRRQFLVSERMIRSVDLKSPWNYKPVFPFTPTTDSP